MTNQSCIENGLVPSSKTQHWSLDQDGENINDLQEIIHKNVKMHIYVSSEIKQAL